MSEFTFQLRNEISEVSRLHEIIAELAAKYEWDPNFLFEVDLAMEEVVTNIVRHAFDDHRNHAISIRIISDDNSFIAEIEDEGKPFNPLEAPEPDLNLPLEQRPIGGLGIFLTRKMMDELSYTWKNGKNRLRMVKHLKSTGEN